MFYFAIKQVPSLIGCNNGLNFQNSERMLITHRMYSKEARKHFKTPWSTPLGNHNYHRDTGYAEPEKKDHVTDSAVKHKY